jgi:hypothetical protein
MASDNLKEFGLSGEHYTTPRLILLGLIKRVQVSLVKNVLLKLPQCSEIQKIRF